MSQARQESRTEAAGAPAGAELEATPSEPGWAGACRVGGWAALVSLLASLATMVVGRRAPAAGA